MGDFLLDGIELQEDLFGNLFQLEGGQRCGDMYNDVVREDVFLEELDYEL